MDNPTSQDEADWLIEILDEVGLRQFYPKLTNDLQLTKLSHFDFVSEEDLIELGLSRPASKRLLAAIKKKKSFVTALKNKIVNKLIPSSSASPSTAIKNSTKYHHDSLFKDNQTDLKDGKVDLDPKLGSATCLIKSQDIKIKEEIGHGVHGFVKKGEWTTPNCRVVEVAVKILKEDIMAQPGASFSDFVKEISVMHQLNHPNIIKLFGIVLSSPMMMVLELAPYGNLRDRLRKEDGRTSISQLINFGVQIASGMKYLEAKRFVHRDLAARNIFISHGKGILIGDFGLMRAVPIHENHYIMSERTKIPYPWCAPESLRSKQFSSASDVYMFGVTLWEMFSFGKEPWAKLNLDEILENICTKDTRLPCPEACPTMVYQTLLQCWNTDPACRPKFSTLYQYLSTSYPLVVKSTQNISNVSHRLPEVDDILSNNLSDSYSALNDTQLPQKRNVMTCNVDDRILVIDGQPEKYWWKGQNQRTFEIGWFPLCSTGWLTPKSKIISKPLKNSFIHTGHCGPDGKWGDPRFIDQMYLKNPLAPDDLDVFSGLRLSCGSSNLNNAPKNKTKSKLSRLFGINESSQTTNLINHAYQKFNNEPKSGNRNRRYKETFNIASDTMMTRSHSNDFKPIVDDGPPLIDLSDETPLSSQANSYQGENNQITETLMDMDANFPVISELPYKRASVGNLSQIDDIANYHLSWAGSWNTGTFDGSESNIYSAYYCPTDAAPAPVAPPNGSVGASGEVESNRYYSAVNQDEMLG